ncbi:hypothetical protein KBI23_20225 [bacterium]|jgi:hypothetical protein|nr:hypothetical protein [bacterium]MBP9811437.1 hypothetical protein [bacterium]
MLLNRKFLREGAIPAAQIAKVLLGVVLLSALMAKEASAALPDTSPLSMASAELCSAVSGALAGNSASTSPALGADSAVNSDDPPEPKPENPVRKSCAGGKVRMVIGITPADALGNPASHRHFGHTIMDKIPLTVVLDVDSAVKLDFSTLVQQNVIGFAGSNFTLYKAADGEPPAVSILGPKIKDGRQIYLINLIVQTAVFKPSVVFNLDLRYAAEMLPDGKTPNWLPLTTPDFVVSKMTVVDNGTQLQEGDLSDKAERLPWPTVGALTLGAILMLLHSGVKLLKWLSRIRPRQQIAPNRLAWTIFDANYEDGTANGVKVKHLKAFSHALRVYLATLPQYPQIDALTITEIGLQFPQADSRQIETIVRVITALENEIFVSGADRTSESLVALSQVNLEMLFNDLESLVPRTWDSKE